MLLLLLSSLIEALASVPTWPFSADGTLNTTHSLTLPQFCLPSLFKFCFFSSYLLLSRLARASVPIWTLCFDGTINTNSLTHSLTHSFKWMSQVGFKIDTTVCWWVLTSVHTVNLLDYIFFSLSSRVCFCAVFPWLSWILLEICMVLQVVKQVLSPRYFTSIYKCTINPCTTIHGQLILVAKGFSASNKWFTLTFWRKLYQRALLACLNLVWNGLEARV